MAILDDNTVASELATPCDGCRPGLQCRCTDIMEAERRRMQRGIPPRRRAPSLELAVLPRWQRERPNG